MSLGRSDTLGRTRASALRIPCPGALRATRTWTRDTPDCTLTLPPRPPGFATQKATPLLERAATGPLRNPSQHSSSLGRQDPSLAPDSGGPTETRRRNDSDGRGRGSGAVTYERAREEAGVRPWPQDGKRWCRRGKVGSRCTVHTSGPDQGCRKEVPALTHRDGPRPAGIGLRHPVRSERADACSPGEVRAIRCPVAGRARKGVGGGTRRLHSTTRITLISGEHSAQGPGSDNPRAGCGSEG